MRKYAIGIFIGFCLSFAVGAHAEVKNMIDKVVEGTFPVTVEGKVITESAVVIEGNTYLPVRAFGEAIGYTVGFDADLGVSLTKTVTEETYAKPAVPVKQPQIIIKNDIMDAQINLDNADGVKESLQSRIATYEHQLNIVRQMGKLESVAKYEKMIQDYKDTIAEIERQKVELSK